MDDEQGRTMDYQEHLTAASGAFEAIGASVDEWRTLCGKVGDAMRALTRPEATLPSELSDLRASFAAENSFFRTFATAAEDYRQRIDGFKAFYPAPAASAPDMGQQKSPKTSWFGGRREEKPSVQNDPKPDEQTLYVGQRAYAEAKKRAVEYDARLEEVRAAIEAVVAETEEVGYALRTAVVEINADLRRKPSRKLETHRFQLEDAVAACSERVVQLGLNARVVARLVSAEFVENPFVGEDAFD